MPDLAPANDPIAAYKETVTSVIIAFALAFVFRGFVVEAFLIPTGSMAPTLRGAHMQFKSPQNGYEWAVTPWFYQDRAMQNPFPFQGAGPLGNGGPIDVHDPMSGLEVKHDVVRSSWGDRIFVMKYLYSIYDPERFDVVVFKNPNDPTINYIKRLIGLPNQMVALVDGDVFSRTWKAGDEKADDPWTLDGWQIARKPERAQRAMWQLIYSSEYAPLHPTNSVGRWFKSPWRPSGATASAWQVEDRRDFTFSGNDPATLAWDDQTAIDERSLSTLDGYSYNEYRSNSGRGVFPVSDLRVSMGIRPGAAGEKVSAVILSRGHEFRADIDGTTATLRMRPTAANGANPGEWKTLGTGKAPQLTAGRVTNIDFWHVDQSMKLFINDSLAAEGTYDWTPAQRVGASTGLTMAAVMDNKASLYNPNIYSKPKISIEVSGGPFTLYRVALSRDIFYEPNIYGSEHSLKGEPAKGTHPKNTVVLNANQFFVCGDNSPLSLDARLWDKPNPWVAEIDPTMGVVNRDLLIGKAFFVYFPAPFHNSPVPALPIPDFGSMRFIW